MTLADRIVHDIAAVVPAPFLGDALADGAASHPRAWTERDDGSVFDTEVAVDKPALDPHFGRLFDKHGPAAQQFPLPSNALLSKHKAIDGGLT